MLNLTERLPRRLLGEPVYLRGVFFQKRRRRELRRGGGLRGGGVGVVGGGGGGGIYVTPSVWTGEKGFGGREKKTNSAGGCLGRRCLGGGRGQKIGQILGKQSVEFVARWGNGAGKRVVCWQSCSWRSNGAVFETVRTP